MKIKGTYKVITDKGNTSDIITTVMMAYEIEKDEQIRDLAFELKGSSEIESCKNIFQYAVDNVNYIADVGVQLIKSPARLLHDTTGDCKSYSIFIAACLRYLGIQHFIRFVSYNKNKEATHVYVVAVINNQNIPIDAVAFEQAGKPFGTEIKYTYRADMSSRTTQIAYLAGLEENRIGNVSDFDVDAFLNSGLFDVWLDDEDENSLTQAKGYLLSEWDREWTNYAFANTLNEAIEALNRLQYIGAMIRFYNEYRDDDRMLKHAGYAFSGLIKNKTFDSNEINPENRFFFSDAQHNMVLNFLETSNSGDKTFVANWNLNIVDANINYTDADGRVMGIGSIDELRTNLKKTGGYYLYTFIPDSDANKYGSAVYRKRLVQKRILDLNKDVMVTAKKMTAAEIDNLVYSGCTTTWGAAPINAVKGLGTPGVSIALTTLLLILKVVAASIGIIVAIIAAVNSLKKVSSETIEGGMPEDGEWNTSGTGGSGDKKPNGLTNLISSASMSTLVPVLLIGGLLLKKLKSN